MGSIVLVLASIVTALSFYIIYILEPQKELLRKLKANPKEETDKTRTHTASQPGLILLGLNRKPLEGQNINATIGRNPDGTEWLGFRIIERNEGGAPSGPLFLKVYTSDPLILGSPSTDEPDFKYEGYITPDRRPIPALPAGVSVATQLKLQLLGPAILSGRYPALIKVYYGNGHVSQAAFHLEIVGGRPPRRRR